MNDRREIFNANARIILSYMRYRLLVITTFFFIYYQYYHILFGTHFCSEACTTIRRVLSSWVPSKPIILFRPFSAVEISHVPFNESRPRETQQIRTKTTTRVFETTDGMRLTSDGPTRCNTHQHYTITI